MQLYFIRHAQSENNALWDRTGSSEGRSEDPGLSDVGKQQAELVAKFIGQKNEGMEENAHDPQNRFGFGLTHLYSSLMIRSVETGTAIAEATGVPLVGWKELHETGGIYLTNPTTGEREGKPGNTRSYFQSHFPKFVLPEMITENGWWNRAFELEEELLPRAKMVLQTLLEEHGKTNDHVAIVSHGGFYNVFLTALLNLDVERRTWFSLNNVAITRIDFREDEVFLIYMNRVDFLPKKLIT